LSYYLHPSKGADSGEHIRGTMIVSFLRKQESSLFSRFWTPAFAGVTFLLAKKGHGVPCPFFRPTDWTNTMKLRDMTLAWDWRNPASTQDRNHFRFSSASKELTSQMAPVRKSLTKNFLLYIQKIIFRLRMGYARNSFLSDASASKEVLQ
jgi:hypothetical protein